MTHSHEYRLSLTIPLSGSDREQSAKKAQNHPLIDTLEEAMDIFNLTRNIRKINTQAELDCYLIMVRNPTLPK